MASLLDFPPLFQETAQRIRDRMDADVNAGLVTDDPRWVDTREGTFYYDVTQVALLEIARLWDSISVEVPAAGIVLYAWGPYLDAHAALFNLVRKASVRADGTVLFSGDSGTLVAQGTQVSSAAPDETSDAVEFQTTAAGTMGTQLDTPGPVTGLPDTGGSLTPGTYYYVVTALNDFGETLPSDEVAVVVGVGGISDLSWPAVTGATSYNVYRSLVTGEGYQLLASPTGVSYNDDGTVTPTSPVPPGANTTAGVRLAVQALLPGITGNVAADAITGLDSPNPGVTAVINEAPTLGGAEQETDDELRGRIQLQFQGHGAGNQADYIRWALEEPGVARVFVQPVGLGDGTVQVVIMADENGDPVAGAVITSLQNRLDPVTGQGKGEAPVGAHVTIQTPSIEPITVAATITFKSGYGLDGAGGLVATRQRVVDALVAYINSLDIGETVVYEHVKAQFFTVPGVYTVASLTVNGGSADIVITTDPAQVAQLVLPPTLAST